MWKVETFPFCLALDILFVLEKEDSHPIEGQFTPSSCYCYCAVNSAHTIVYYRQDVLFQTALMKEQAQWVPKFTQVGLEKVAIPLVLYRLLLQEYERAKPEMG